MRPTLYTDLVMQALLAAVWRRKPPLGLLLHSDYGCQFTGGDWQRFLKNHKMVCSISCCGNGHSNVVANIFLRLLKREHVKRKIYSTHGQAHADMLD